MWGVPKNLVEKRIFHVTGKHRLCHVNEFCFGNIDGFTQIVGRSTPCHLLGEVTIFHHVTYPADIRIDGRVFLFLDHMPGIPAWWTG